MKTPDTTEAMPSANNNTDFRLLNSFKKATHWVENLSATSTFEEMKNSSRWLLHKDKRPFYIDGRPRSGELDGLLDTNRLATYSKAKEALSKMPEMSGLGFALGDGWQGIDLDKVTDQNKHLESLIEKLPGYVELSPSGKGVHAIGYGQPIRTIKGNGLEVYGGKRFFTVTEKVIRDSYLTDLTEFVERNLAPIVKGTFPDTPAARVDSEVALPIGGSDWAKVKDAIKSISADCEYDTWIKVGMALHSTGHQDAFEIWVEWSETAPHRLPPEGEFTKKWRSFNGNRVNGVSIATLFMLAKQNGWHEPPIEISQLLAGLSKELSLKQADKNQRYKLQSVEELIGTGPVRWRVKGVVPERGLAAIYGQSGTGKTFLALDMAISIANGSDWFGYRVKPCPVVYICLEGVAGLSTRLKAYCAEVGHPSGVSFITQGLNLREDKDLIDLLASIKACNQTGGIVVIDTLNMATPGMDENSSVDMGRAIQAAKTLEQVGGGLVLLVHHSGKTSGKGLRGHSSLHAALDVVIEVTQSGSIHEWTVTKAKDAGNGKSHSFMLESVVMGVDADGDPITSCVVRPNEGSGIRTKPLTQVQKMAMDAFVAAASKTAESNGLHRATLEDWRPEFYRRSTAESQDGKRKAFTRVRNDLVGLGYLTVINDTYSIPSPFANLPIKS